MNSVHGSDKAKTSILQYYLITFLSFSSPVEVGTMNEIMENETEETGETESLAVIPINGGNQFRLIDESSTHQCQQCGADYSIDSLRELLTQNPVHLNSPTSRRTSSSSLLRRRQRFNQQLNEVPLATTILKLGINCRGCIEKIHQIVSTTKGVHEIVVDRRKETVTFKATMEVKALTETLRRRPVMGVAERQIEMPKDEELVEAVTGRIGANEFLQNSPVNGDSELQEEMGQTQNEIFVRNEDTCIDFGFENEQNSCTKGRGTKSEVQEWALLSLSLLLEGLSAIFDQLGYTLVGMVMAYVALLLYMLELTVKALRERVTWVAASRSLLPCFRRRSARNSPSLKLLVTPVESFGLASALWQCFYSTMQYKYALQPSQNPLKMCLLPFLFVFVCLFPN